MANSGLQFIDLISPQVVRYNPESVSHETKLGKGTPDMPTFAMQDDRQCWKGQTHLWICKCTLMTVRAESQS